MQSGRLVATEVQSAEPVTGWTFIWDLPAGGLVRIPSDWNASGIATGDINGKENTWPTGNAPLHRVFRDLQTTPPPPGLHFRTGSRWNYKTKNISIGSCIYFCFEPSLSLFGFKTMSTIFIILPGCGFIRRSCWPSPRTWCIRPTFQTQSNLSMI
jgi:hypothetical protein